MILVNVTWVNNITTRVEFKKGRIMSLSMANNQLIENYNDEWSVGLGYRFDKLGLILNNSKVSFEILKVVDEFDISSSGPNRSKASSASLSIAT